MIHTWRLCITIALLALTAAVAEPTCFDSSEKELEALNHDTISALRSRNYTIVEGQFKVFQSSSFGANPGNPYVTYFHPGVVEKRLPLFKLSPQTAVLFIGCTPYTPTYFSWRSYAFTSRGHLTFASLGDTLNNLVINSTAPSGASTGGRVTAVITTADQHSYADVTAAMVEAGLPRSSINLDAVPSTVVNMQHDPTLRFIMLHRASVWSNEAEKHGYFNQTRSVYFVEPPRARAAQPIPTLPLRTPGTGTAEASMEGLTQQLAALKSAVSASLGHAGYRPVAAGFNGGKVQDLGLDGFRCLKEGTNCKGDNRDTHYLQYHDSQMAATDMYVMVGTNSVETHKCTYTNFGLYQVAHTALLNRTKLTSTNLTVDNRQLLGSAQQFGVNDTRLFAYRIARNCSGIPFCLQVGLRDIPASKEWAVAYRPYLEPATATGPKLSELITPIVLKFSK